MTDGECVSPIPLTLRALCLLHPVTDEKFYVDLCHDGLAELLPSLARATDDSSCRTLTVETVYHLAANGVDALWSVSSLCGVCVFSVHLLLWRSSPCVTYERLQRCAPI